MLFRSIQSQIKQYVNQSPLYDVFDSNGVSFSDQSSYPGSDFIGCSLFEFATGTGTDDPILGIPLAYSSVDNIGDITFNASLNTATFSYLEGSVSTSMPVNYGYVYKYKSRTEYTRELGWQTAVAPSVQYQLFSFDYTAGIDVPFICDIPASDLTTWPSVQVYINKDRKSTRLNSSHSQQSRMPSSA